METRGALWALRPQWETQLLKLICKYVSNHSFLQSSFYSILVYCEFFWELFPPTPNAGYDPWPKFWSRQVAVPFPTPKKDYSPCSTWREPGFSKALALQSTLTALILICRTSLSKKLNGKETSGNKQPSKKRIHLYRGEGAKKTELIHLCGFLNCSIHPAVCSVSLGMGSQMAECWIQFIDLFPKGATRCKKTLNKPKPNNPQNKTTLFCLLVQELRPFVFPNCNPLRWRLKSENSGSSSHKTETRDWTLYYPPSFTGVVSAFFFRFPHLHWPNQSLWFRN